MVLNEKGILRQFSLVVYPIDLVVAIGDMEDEINKRYIPRDKQYDWLSPPPEEVAEAVYNVEEKETFACVPSEVAAAQLNSGFPFVSKVMV